MPKIVIQTMSSKEIPSIAAMEYTRWGVFKSICGEAINTNKAIHTATRNGTIKTSVLLSHLQNNRVPRGTEHAIKRRSVPLSRSPETVLKVKTKAINDTT